MRGSLCCRPEQREEKRDDGSERVDQVRCTLAHRAHDDDAAARGRRRGYRRGDGADAGGDAQASISNFDIPLAYDALIEGAPPKTPLFESPRSVAAVSSPSKNA